MNSNPDARTFRFPYRWLAAIVMILDCLAIALLVGCGGGDNGPAGPSANAPTVTLTAPAADATVAGTVTLTAEAERATTVQFFANGTQVVKKD